MRVAFIVLVHKVLAPTVQPEDGAKEVSACERISDDARESFAIARSTVPAAFLVCHKHFVRLGHNQHVLEYPIVFIESATNQFSASTTMMERAEGAWQNVNFK